MKRGIDGPEADEQSGAILGWGAKAPKVGAVCGKTARMNLGRREVTRVLIAKTLFLLRCMSLVVAHRDKPSRLR
jgi:hypothetical protein